MNSNRASFTAADAMPVKLLQNHELIKSIVEDKIIPPLHVQLIPTNKCNLKCSFCSCDNEDRSLEMSKDQIIETLIKLKNLHTEGVTITGGGEPLLWEHLELLILVFKSLNIKTGLVTNGVLLSKITSQVLDTLTWCRISQGDTREKWTSRFLDRLSGVITNATNVGWAFSYVVSDNPNFLKIHELLKFANTHNFTHVRLVSDLLCTDKIPMKELKAYLDEFAKDITTPIIYQDRKQPEKGDICRVCYLRPVITPDMKIYACCGSMYSMKKPTLNFPPELCLGDVSQFPEIIAKSSEPFENAKLCEYCYYMNYNRTLDMLMTPTMHNKFI